MTETVYSLIDEKIERIVNNGKRASVVIINSDIYKKLQMMQLEADLSQQHGVIRNPNSFKNYKGLTLIASDNIETVEVF